MKYQAGRVRRQRARSTIPARRVVITQEDRYRYSTPASYTPARLSALFQAANSGDIEQLCLCGREILERNWDIIGAMDQRADALCGVGWEIRPGGPGEAAKQAAEGFAAALDETGLSLGFTDRTETFQELLRNLLDGVILPFSAAEIVWKEGGAIEGFQTIEPHCFTLRDSMVPRLVTEEFPDGMELVPDQFIIHQHRRRPDPARGGKIRVLAWLHCLQNWPLKDLFSFIERFGMPFVVARVDQNTWENEREVLQRIIRSFGPDGGGVFHEFDRDPAAQRGKHRRRQRLFPGAGVLPRRDLHAAGRAARFERRLRRDEQRRCAICRPQDILEADARAIESTIRAQIAAPWTRFQFGDGVPVPKIHFKVEPSEDEKATADKLLVRAQTIQTLASSGFIPEVEEVSKIFSLCRCVMSRRRTGFGQQGSLGLATEVPEGDGGAGGTPPVAQEGAQATNAPLPGSGTLPPDKRAIMYGTLIRGGLLTPTRDLEEKIRAELGLAPLPAEAQRLWDETGGVRKPLTLKEPTPLPAGNAVGLSADKSDKSDLSDLSDALTEWLGPLAAELDQLSADTEISDEEFSRRLSACAEGRKNGSTGKLETFLEGQIYDGMARGMTS